GGTCWRCCRFSWRGSAWQASRPPRLRSPLRSARSRAEPDAPPSSGFPRYMPAMVGVQNLPGRRTHQFRLLFVSGDRLNALAQRRVVVPGEVVARGDQGVAPGLVELDAFEGRAREGGAAVGFGPLQHVEERDGGAVGWG